MAQKWPPKSLKLPKMAQNGTKVAQKVWLHSGPKLLNVAVRIDRATKRSVRASAQPTNFSKQKRPTSSNVNARKTNRK